eukprot:PhF_6_TR42122/c0_g1_i1/m.63613
MPPLYAIDLKGYIFTHSKETADRFLSEITNYSDPALPSSFQGNHVRAEIITLHDDTSETTTTTTAPYDDTALLPTKLSDVITPQRGSRFLPQTPILRCDAVTRMLTYRVSWMLVILLLTTSQVFYCTPFFIGDYSFVNTISPIGALCASIVFTLPLFYMSRARIQLLLRTFDFWYLSGIFWCLQFCMAYLQVCSGVHIASVVLLNVLFTPVLSTGIFGLDAVVEMSSRRRNALIWQNIMFATLIVVTIRGTPQIFRSEVQECIEHEINFGFSSTTLGSVMGSCTFTFIGFMARYVFKLSVLGQEFSILSDPVVSEAHDPNTGRGRIRQ